jgi:transcriptional regulator GlxA family with amidase domain
MVNLSVLYTHHCRPISLAAILDVFESVNSFYIREQHPPFFDIQLVTDDRMEPVNIHGIYQTKKMCEADNTDIVLIPAFNSVDMSEAINSNVAFIPWLHKKRQCGAELASFCTGAFLLAASGLLNGKKATTHVMATDSLSANFPAVLLEPEAVLTFDGGIYTSGGATSTFHLLLYIVEKYCGREKAVQAAKMFAIDMDRNKQNYFATFLPAKNHNDDLVNQAQQLMETHYSQAATIDEIIGHLPSSRRNFVRRFKQATGITPIEYLQRTRVEAAKKMLEKTSQSVSEIMYNTGYNDSKAFREVFKKSVGLTPKEYRDKFNGNPKVEAKLV